MRQKKSIERAFQKRWHRNKKEIKGKILSWQFVIQKVASSFITQIVIGIVFIFMVTAKLVYDYRINPEITLKIEGKVSVEIPTSSLLNLENVLLTIEDTPAVAETNEDGNFTISVKVKKNDKSVKLSCSKRYFHPQTKTVDIPLNQGKEIVVTYTNFHLEPKGYYTPGTDEGIELTTYVTY